MNKLEQRLKTLYDLSIDTELCSGETFRNRYNAIMKEYNFNNKEMNSYWLPYQLEQLNIK